MSEDPSNAGGDAPANGGQAGGQVALLSDPVDVIIDKLLRYVVLFATALPPTRAIAAAAQPIEVDSHEAVEWVDFRGFWA